MKNSFLYLSILILALACSNDEEYQFKTIESFLVDKETVGEFVELNTMPNCPQ